MRFLSHLALLTLILFTNGTAMACSCLPPNSRDKAIQEAVAVFRATAVGVVNERLGQSPIAKYANQSASMKVVEVFKGRYKVGEVVAIRQNVGPGLCGASIKNEPPFLDLLDTRGGRETPRTLRGEWIIYAYGTEPFDVSYCSRSSPIEFGAEELKGLRRLKSAKATPNNSLHRTREE
jgi:hypothetical protein